MKLVNQVLSHLKYRQKQKQSNSDKYSYDAMKSFTGNVISSFIIVPKKRHRNTGKPELKYPSRRLGTDKYNIIIYLTETFGINITNNKVIIASNRETFFEGYNLSQDDYFNMSLSADILSPDEITKIRNYMKGKKKDTTTYIVHFTLYQDFHFEYKNYNKMFKSKSKDSFLHKTKINGNYTYHAKTKLFRAKNSYKRKLIKFGPDKYKISLYYDNYAISISHKRIKIANNDEVIFSGYTIDGDEYFNLVLAYTDLPSPQEIKYIREYTSKYCVPSDYTIFLTKQRSFCIAHLIV